MNDIIIYGERENAKDYLLPAICSQTAATLLTKTLQSVLIVSVYSFFNDARLLVRVRQLSCKQSLRGLIKSS